MGCIPNWGAVARCAGLLFACMIMVGNANAGSEAVLPPQTGLSIAGWIENAWLMQDGKQLSVEAKLDTGAKSSAINAPDYRAFMRNGEKWISFSVTNNKGEGIEVEAPFLRNARIRRAGVPVRERPVIALRVCVGGQNDVTEFTLADRSQLNYQMLIGRSFLKGRILVDSGRSFLASGLCGKAK